MSETNENPSAAAVGSNRLLADWVTKQIWPSLDAINAALKCPRPLAGSGGCHWWYNDSEEMERQVGYGHLQITREDAGAEADYVPIICKTCELKLKLSADAPEYPAV